MDRKYAGLKIKDIRSVKIDKAKASYCKGIRGIEKKKAYLDKFQAVASPWKSNTVTHPHQACLVST